MTAKNNGKFVFNDTINAQDYKLNTIGDNSGELYVNNAIKNADISQNNVTSYAREASLLNYNNSLSVNSGIVNINHIGMSPLNFNNFANTGTININSVDINPATETMGRLTGISNRFNQCKWFECSSRSNKRNDKCFVCRFHVCYVFEHADAFTQLPSLDRFAMINENRYALSSDFNNNLPTPNASEFNNKAGWFRPYVSFEKMNLRNAGAVNTTTYGSLFGFDSDFQHYKRGWTGITTGYIGYNGSQLRYTGADTTMNGGLVGFTQSFYKGNFWTALTLSAGASVGESNTIYGKEDFTTLFAGLGSKTGYNFEFKEGKYIIQPVWFMSYTFGKTFDYTNAAGVRMDSSPMHSIMLNPSVRFIANSKKGWQPYLSVGMVWNAMSVRCESKWCKTT